MTGNSVGNYCFVVLNVKLQVKFRFKMFYCLLKLLYTAFALNSTTNIACFARNLCISQQQACNLQTRNESLNPCISSSVFYIILGKGFLIIIHINIALPW